jgi:5'-3' exonuclease
LKATGLAAFYGQILTGDRVDNIPGLDKCGPVAAYNILSHAKDMFSAVEDEYMEGVDGDYEDLLLEQGRLCWMTRKLHEDGSPVLWEIGMED